MDTNSRFIVTIVIITILLLYILDQVLMVSYILKTSIKLVFLAAIPLIHALLTRSPWIRRSFSSKAFTYRKTTLVLSLIVFLGILGLYGLLGSQFDLPTIMDELTNKYGIQAQTFLYYGLYITLINSFIEEFFFRGFVFLNLRAAGYPKIAYGFSALAFAIYHIAIFRNWFSLPVFLLALAGLTAGGLLFAYLDAKPNAFINSWIVHMSADAAIILIGLHLFAG